MRYLLSPAMLTWLLAGTLLVQLLNIPRTAALNIFTTSTQYPRHVVKVLSTKNGLYWGEWQHMEFCPSGTYASAFKFKLDPSHLLRSDDTALNGISLRCTRPHTKEYYGTIESQPGPWGTWRGPKECRGASEREYFLTAFQMRAETSRGSFGDDTAVNNLRFKCRLLRENHYYTLHDRGGPWGSWGHWSQSCPLGSAICGIQTKLEAPRGSGDDASLTDIKFFCCNDVKMAMECVHPME